VVRRALWPADRVRNEADRHAGDAEGLRRTTRNARICSSSSPSASRAYVEPHYVGDDQLRGYEDEAEVRRIYAERFAPVHEVGFITNDRWGFTLGYSPDGLVGEHGQIEAKSRRQKYQIQTIIENVVDATIPVDFLIQVQTGLLVSERQWCDFVSYCGGLHMLPSFAHTRTPRFRTRSSKPPAPSRSASPSGSSNTGGARRRGHAADPHRTQG
jgi:hypothetical protein